MVEIRIVDQKHDLNGIAPLFDAYRVFYDQPSDIEESRSFLYELFAFKSSIIIGAYMDDKVVGFTQLFPSFSSVSLQKLYILNDLFVHPEYRNKGIGSKLIAFVQKIAVEQNWKGFLLETAKDNPAQYLYEKMGFEKDLDFYHYSWNARK